MLITPLQYNEWILHLHQRKTQENVVREAIFNDEIRNEKTACLRGRSTSVQTAWKGEQFELNELGKFLIKLYTTPKLKLHEL